MEVTILVVQVCVYALGARLILSKLGNGMRDVLFAALNLLATYWFFFHSGKSSAVVLYSAYVALVSFQYGMLRLFCKRDGWLPWLAFMTPILVLILANHLPSAFYEHVRLTLGGAGRPIKSDFMLSSYLVGLSYLAFRSSYLVLEVRNGIVAQPRLSEYLGFCFFLPTMAVGPINSYGNYSKAFGSDQPRIPFARSLYRILVGAVKFRFFGDVFGQLTYTNFLLDDHHHHWIDLPVSAIGYYLFLYFNFSGFCDMVIGTAGVIGIPVSENFQNPLAARNLKDFWNRWHITLSTYMRDVVFSPLTKFLAQFFGPTNINHAIGVSIFVVFLLVGVWHGVGWNYAAFGAIHAIGVVGNHYYTIGLKRWLGKEGFKSYNANPWIHGVAVVITFSYVSMSLLFFANTFPQIKEILDSLQ